MDEPAAASPATWATRLFMAFLLAQTVALVVWLRLDHTGWYQDDSSTHLSNTLLFYQALTPPRPASVLACLSLYLKSFPYPPLCYLLTVPCQWLCGVHPDSCCLVNVAAYDLGLVAVFGIGRRVWNDRVGLGAALVLGSDAMVLHQVQQFYVDATVFALTAAVLWAVLESDGGRRPAWTVTAGLLVGLGMLAKWTFLVLAMVPVGVILSDAAKGGATARRAAFRAALVGLLVSLPWYVANLDVVVPFARWNNRVLSEAPPLWSWAGATFYLADTINLQLGLPLALLLLAGLAVGLRGGSRERRILLLQFALAYLLMSFVRNRNARYTPPLLIPLIPFAVAGLDALRPRRVAWALLGALVALRLWAGMTGPNQSAAKVWELQPGRLPLVWFNRFEPGPWDAAAMRLAELTRHHADDFASSPVEVALGKPLQWGLTPASLAYWLRRADLLASGRGWPPERHLVSRFHYRWEEDIPDDVLDSCELAWVYAHPRTEPVRARLTARRWRLVETVPLPDGHAYLLYQRPQPEEDAAGG